MPITQLASESLAPNDGRAALRWDGTRILVGIGYPPPTWKLSLSMYAWDGAAFSLVNTVDGGFELETAGTRIRLHAHTSRILYDSPQGSTTASGGGLGAWSFNGSVLAYDKTVYVYPGMIGMGPGEWRGKLYSYDRQGSFVFTCGRTFEVVSPPPPDFVLQYVYLLDAIEYDGGVPTHRKTVTLPSSAAVGNVLCWSNYVFVCGSDLIRKYEFAGPPTYALTLDSSYAVPPGVISDIGHFLAGSYIFGYDGSVVTAYDWVMNVVATIDTTRAITSINMSGDRLFVSQSGPFIQTYTFDGAAFTLEDEGAIAVSSSVVLDV